MSGKKLYIGFDIDGTLVDEIKGEEKAQIDLKNKARYINLEGYGIYLLAHGVRILFDYLNSKNDSVEYFFYSAGIKERNEALVKEILSTIMEQKEIEKIKIYSREDCIEFIIFDPKNGNEDEWITYYKKSLKRIIKEENENREIPIGLEQIILIDNTESIILDDEKSNLFVCPTTFRGEYEKLYDADLTYDLFEVYQSYYKGLTNIFYITAMISTLIASSSRSNDDFNYLRYMNILIWMSKNNKYSKLVGLGMELLSEQEKTMKLLDCERENFDLLLFLNEKYDEHLNKKKQNNKNNITWFGPETQVEKKGAAEDYKSELPPSPKKLKLGEKS